MYKINSIYIGTYEERMLLPTDEDGTLFIQSGQVETSPVTVQKTLRMFVTDGGEWKEVARIY